MIKLLRSSKQRQLQFIELLIEQDGWIILKNIANELDCSEKVLITDIKIINSLLHPISIITSKKDGVILNFPNNYSVDYIYSHFITDSTEFTLLETLFLKGSISESKLAEQLFMSEATLQRLIKRLNRQLDSHNIHIDKHPLRLIGDEVAIRHFFYYLLIEKYPLGDLPYNEYQLQALHEFMYTQLPMLNTKLSYPDFNKLRALILTNATRYRHGYFTEHKHSKTSEKNDHLIDCFIQNEAIIIFFQQEFGFTLTKEAFLDIFFILIRPTQALPKIDSLKYDTLTTSVFQKVSDLLDDISMQFDIPLDSKETLILELYHAYQLYWGYNNYLIYNKNKYFFRYTQMRFPNFINYLADKLINFEMVEFSNPSFFNEVLYIIIIHWRGLIKALEKKMLPVKIGIFGDLDLNHSAHISDLINHHFKDRVDTQILSALNEKQAALEARKYDLILSTISGLKFPVKTICISPVLTIHDLNKIKQSIEQQTSNNYLVTYDYVFRQSYANHLEDYYFD